jgi:hypothetical protein
MSANVPTRALGPIPENAPQSGWAAWLVQIARLANFLLKSLGTTPITAVGDAAYQIVQSDRLVETSAAFAAARIWTLPPASSVDAGYEIAIVDAIATITAANTLTVALSGADTINGAAASLVLNIAGSAVALVSDGLSNWAIKAQLGKFSTGVNAHGALYIDGVSLAGNLPATATNDNATAGHVGELIESEVLVASAVALTTGTAANVTSISLTAGDWDVWGNVATNPNGATTQTAIEAAISTTSATLPTRPGKGAFTQLFVTFQAGISIIVPTGTTRLSLASTTTVYLVALSNFGVSTNAAYGYIGARRRR